MSSVAGLLGGLAAISASIVTHPIDSIKVRMYLYGEGKSAKSAKMSLVVKMYETEGFKSFYRGISAAVARQGVYSATRFAVDDFLQRKYDCFMERNSFSSSSPFLRQIVCSATAGAIGAALACPLDTVLVRMQADGRLPPALRRNYRNVFHGLFRIVSDDGARCLFRGLSPVVARGCSVTCAQFTTYSVTKDFLINSLKYDGSAISTHLLASTLAGTVTSLIVNPLDVVKCRIMQSRATQVAKSVSSTLNQRNAAESEMLAAYRSVYDCISRLLHVEGPGGFYKGLVPNLLRNCPQVILMWVLYEQYVRLYKFSVCTYYGVSEEKALAVSSSSNSIQSSNMHKVDSSHQSPKNSSLDSLSSISESSHTSSQIKVKKVIVSFFNRLCWWKQKNNDHLQK